MGRIIFGNNGKPLGVDGTKNSNIGHFSMENYGIEKKKIKTDLKTSSSLEFLKEDKNVEYVSSKDYWSLSIPECCPIFRIMELAVQEKVQ